jgi:Flp pilus assembly protein TadG
MRRNGQSLLELTIGIVVLAPVVLVLLDLSFMLLGAQSNDKICLSAARAAAAGDPSQASARAQSVIERAEQRKPAAMISNPVLSEAPLVEIRSCPETQKDPFTNKEFNPGGPITGAVTVTTQFEFRPLIINTFFTKERKLTFRAQHSFPITYVVPAASPETDPKNTAKTD